MSRSSPPYGFYEFFAGGGMARMGLGRRWRCLLANEWCQKKAQSYRKNFAPGDELLDCDIRSLDAADLPGLPTLAWASFPCQDMSLAGNGQGLSGRRSSTFWAFWHLVLEMKRQNRPVPLVVLENVVGTVSAQKGRDFRSILKALGDAGYWYAPIIVDAIHFVPQSRRRLFVIAGLDTIRPPRALIQSTPTSVWHTSVLTRAHQKLTSSLAERWLWLDMPKPSPAELTLDEIIEANPRDVRWHTHEETSKLLRQMLPARRKRVRKSVALGAHVVGTVYRRTRHDGDGNKVQRAEIRFDGTAGCLRTPSGGSSRQIVVVIDDGKIKSRLLSPREAARLMGVRETYVLPRNYNEAYHLMGDAVVVPAVAWINRHILLPLARQTRRVIAA